MDITNITIDEEEEYLFKDYGTVLVGNIVEYSSSTKDEGEDEQKKKDEEKIRIEEAIIVVEKAEEVRLKDAWKSVMQDSLLMSQLKKAITVVDKVTFQHEVEIPYVAPLVTPIVVAITSLSML